MRVETEYQKRLKEKKKQQTNFRKFVRGDATPMKVREYIGMNHWELKELIESRMLPAMGWSNYGSYWVIDHLVPFWLFDPKNDADMKMLWHPDNLFPMVWADNNHKQGDLRFSILKLRKYPWSYTVEKLIERCEKEIKKLDKYL